MISELTLAGMRLFMVAAGTFMGVVGPAPAQPAGPSALTQLEREMLARVSERATANGGLRIGAGELDLRLTLGGEPEEVIGPTTHATTSLAVGSTRLEPLDSIISREVTFNRGRYDLRLEDRKGNCLVVHHEVTFDSALVKGRRTTERCEPLYMAEVVRRARRIARLPLSAGRLVDHWSAALAATGTADVYLDSVVITTTAITLRASYPVPATAVVDIDSVAAGLAQGEASWSVVRKSAAIRVDTTLRQGGEWRRTTRRFVIPIDSAFDLSKAWPVFEVYLTVPNTADNPLGLGWTYAHERKEFFRKVPVQLPRRMRPDT